MVMGYRKIFNIQSVPRSSSAAGRAADHSPPSS